MQTQPVLQASRQPVLRQQLVNFLRTYGSIIGMLLVLSIFQILKPNFFSPANVGGVLRQSTILVVMSMGLTIAMALRGVDLSVAQIADVTGLMAAALIIHDQPVWLAFLGPLALALLIGSLNAFLMAYLGVPAIIGTLGMMFIIRSGELIYTRGSEPQILFTLPRAVTADFFFLGQESIGPIPALIVLAIVMFAIAYGLMNFTAFGRYANAVGSNVRASYLAGLDVRRVFGTGFIISALMAAVAGVALVSRTGIAAPRGAEPYLLDAFAAVYLGTLASPRGKMNILGTVIGALFVSFLGNGLTLMGLGAPYRYALNGAFILLAMAIGALRREH
ncbi:MAG: ABC transporter permease [Anaerolineae bacterium]|nr:ABC transporter permease [Anaerolineae bacterium]